MSTCHLQIFLLDFSRSKPGNADEMEPGLGSGSRPLSLAGYLMHSREGFGWLHWGQAEPRACGPFWVWISGYLGRRMPSFLMWGTQGSVVQA